MFLPLCFSSIFVLDSCQTHLASSGFLQSCYFWQWGWQLACDGFTNRANCRPMKWNKPAWWQVPRAVREPSGIHVRQCCTSQAPQVKRCFVIPASITSVSVLNEQLRDLHQTLFTALLFPSNWACFNLTQLHLPKLSCWCALASSKVSFTVNNWMFDFSFA